MFLLALTLSMVGLGLAARRIPIGTAYAVWTGVGAALTVLFAMVTGDEPVTGLKVLFLTGIIGAVVGLTLLESPQRPQSCEQPAAGSARED